jgi:hypothetical protein
MQIFTSFITIATAVTVEEYQQLPERTASNRGCFSAGVK